LDELYARKHIARKFVLAMTRPLRAGGSAAGPPCPGVASVSAAAPPPAFPSGGASSPAGPPPSGATGVSAEAPFSSASFRAIQWRDLRAAVPDKGKHTAPIAGEATWGDLEDAFGMHPLMISCWTCLMGAIPWVRWGPFATPNWAPWRATRELAGRSGVTPCPEIIALHLVPDG